MKNGLRFIVESLKMLAGFFLPSLLFFHSFDLLKFLDNFLALQLDFTSYLFIVFLSHVDTVLLSGRQKVASQSFNLLRIFLLRKKEDKNNI